MFKKDNFPVSRITFFKCLLIEVFDNNKISMVEMYKVTKDGINM